MLVACRLAGLSAREATMRASMGARNAGPTQPLARPWAGVRPGTFLASATRAAAYAPRARRALCRPQRAEEARRS